MEEGRKRGTEEDISNSKGRAVFPWQLGSHRNSRAKDAIRMKKTPTFLPSDTCANIGSAFCFLRQRLSSGRMASGRGLSGAISGVKLSEGCAPQGY